MARRAFRTTSQSNKVFFKPSGFTIVELLIVVVVIAILAAITVVAYTGIAGRAKASAVQTNLKQQSTKLSIWKLDNGNVFPADLAAARAAGMLTDATDATYTAYIPSTDRSNYCLTAQNSGGVKYSISSTASAPVLAECVTNLVDNPTVATDYTNWSKHTALSSATTAQMDGSSAMQATRNATGATGMYVGKSTALQLKTNTTYTASATVMASIAGTTTIELRAGTGNTSFFDAGSASSSANVPVRISTSGSTGSSSSTANIAVLWSGGAVGDVFTLGKVMLTEGATQYAYRDGNSPGWFWNGAQNNSTSVGPAVAQ